MNSTVKTIMFWVFILVCLMLLWTVVQRSSSMGKSADIGYSDLLDKIEAGQVQDATIQGDDVHGHLKGAKDEFHTTISTSLVDSLTKELRAAKVATNIEAGPAPYRDHRRRRLGVSPRRKISSKSRPGKRDSHNRTKQRLFHITTLGSQEDQLATYKGRHEMSVTGQQQPRGESSVEGSAR